MNTVRWGIIGCGQVTEVKSGPALQRADGSALTAVMRRSAAQAEDYARRHDVPAWYSDADGLIRDPGVDAVYVATPVGAHADYALRVCAAGKPCYVEKPMARNAVECDRMNEAFAKAGLPLFVAFYRRALPRFLAAKRLLDQGRLGRLTHVSCRYTGNRPPWDTEPLPWRFVAKHSGGGLFLDLGSHTLDILDYMLGPLRDVTGTASNRAGVYDVEDRVTMQFRTPGDVEGSAQWDFAGKSYEDIITFTGSDGALQLSTFGDEPLQLDARGRKNAFPFSNPEHIQQPLIQTIVDQLRGKGTCPSTGTSAARTSRVMDQVLADYYGGRDNAFWDRPHTWPGPRA